MKRLTHISGKHLAGHARLFLMAVTLLTSVYRCTAATFPEKTILFEEQTDGFVLYRIPGVVVTARGTVLAYCEARKYRTADRGEIEIHLRRSTDKGCTWSPPVQMAHRGPRLSRNPHMPKDKRKKDMGGPTGPGNTPA